MAILITRPETDAHSTAKELEAKGHEVIRSPLMEICFRSAAKKELEETLSEHPIQALVFTSANGVRAYCTFSTKRDLKVMAVGEASAKEALKAGFPVVHAADHDLPSLAEMIHDECHPDLGPLLHSAARDVTGDLEAMIQPDGFELKRVVTYSAEKATAFTKEAQEAFENGGITHVMLFSPRTAVIFKELTVDMDLSNVHLFCLSKAVAKVMEGVEAPIHVSEEAKQEMLCDDLESC